MIKKTLNRIIRFLKNNLWNIFFVFLSVSIIIRNALIEVGYLENVGINIIINKIIFWIAIAYISSFIFYLVIDFYPKKREKSKLNNHIDRSLKNILSLAKSPFNTIVGEVDFLSLTRDDIKKGCKESKTQDLCNAGKMVNGNPFNSIPFSKLELLINRRENCFKEIRDLLNYNQYLNGNIVGVLTEIMDSTFMLLVGSMVPIDKKILRGSFEKWSDEMYNYYIIVKKLHILVENKAI